MKRTIINFGETCRNIRKMDTENMVEMWHEIACMTDNWSVYYYMDDFNFIMSRYDALQVADGVSRGKKFHSLDDWFLVSPTGIIESATSKEAEDYIFNMTADFLAEESDLEDQDRYICDILANYGVLEIIG